MKRLLTASMLVLLGAIVVVGLVACGGGSTDTTAAGTDSTTAGSPKTGGTLRVVTTESATDLGYPPDFRQRAFFFAMPAIEPLVAPSEDIWASGEIVGVLAASWEAENESKSWTFHLREGVLFHDGTPFNAEAVKFNVELMKAHGSRSTYKQLESIDVIDDLTVRLNFSQSYVTLLADLFDESRMISPTSYNNSGATEEERQAWATENPVGTGPFKLESYTRGSTITWVRNDDYWGEGPNFDRVEVYMVPDPTVGASMMKAGEADIYTHADTQAVLDLAASGDFTIGYNNDLAVVGVFPSAKDPASVYADKRVREALEYAIDREAIASSLASGGLPYEPRYQLANPDSSAYAPDLVRKYDPEKAKQLLRDAGYGDGFETTCYVAGGNDLQDSIAVAVQSYLAAVGITMKIETTEIARIRSMMVKGWGKDNLLINEYSFTPIPYTNDINWFQPGQDRMQGDTVLTEEMGAVAVEMKNATDVGRLAELHDQLMRLTAQESIGVFITTEVYVYATVKGLHTTWMQPWDRVWHMNEDWME